MFSSLIYQNEYVGRLARFSRFNPLSRSISSFVLSKLALGSYFRLHRFPGLLFG